MYFFTQSGKRDASSFAQVATFFIDKFPAAFGATATYFNSKQVSSEDTYIRIDAATEVTYDFEEKPQHAQSFARFQEQVLQSFQKESEAESALFFLDLLLEQSSMILQLPISVKQSECTIQRFYLLLWPLLALAEHGNYARAKDLTVKFIDLLVEQSAYSLKIKVEALVQLFNSTHTNSGIKSFAFEKMIELCMRENCCDIVVDRARKIVTESASWNLSKAERRTLYEKVGRALDQLNESSHAFEVLHANLKLYSDQDASLLPATEEDARRCVILAMKAVNVINFAELLELPSVQQLTQKHAKVFSLLNMFTSASAAEFKTKLAEYRDLINKEGLTEQELIVKKSYVEICSLNTQVTNFSYDDLSKLLNIAKDDIEMWAIEAIQNKIIDAKIDQLNEVVVIKSHMLREIKLQEWKAIQQKIRAWKDRFQRVQSVLQATQTAQSSVV